MTDASSASEERQKEQMTSDSSAAAPSVESLRQEWLSSARSIRDAHYLHAGDVAFTLERCAEQLQPILDHERSLVARLQALDQKWHEVWFEEKERNRSLVAEIQRLTDEYDHRAAKLWDVIKAAEAEIQRLREEYESARILVTSARLRREAAEAEIQQKGRDIERLTGILDAERQMWTNQSKVDRAEVQRLADALKTYGLHARHCDIGRCATCESHTDHAEKVAAGECQKLPCTCGFSDTLKTYTEKE